jgi:hypothetical protein
MGKASFSTSVLSLIPGFGRITMSTRILAGYNQNETAGYKAAQIISHFDSSVIFYRCRYTRGEQRCLALKLIDCHYFIITSGLISLKLL